MLKRSQQLCHKAGSQNSKGATLVELVIAIAIIGVVIVSLVYAISSSVLATNWVDQKTTVTNIARSQMEYVKSQPYGDSYQELSLDDLPQDWAEDDDINILVEDVTAGYAQRITVAVSYVGKSYELQGYKANR